MLIRDRLMKNSPRPRRRRGAANSWEPQAHSGAQGTFAQVPKQEVLLCPPHALLPLYCLAAQGVFPFLPFLVAPPLRCLTVQDVQVSQEAPRAFPHISRIPLMIVSIETVTCKPSELR